MSLQHITSLTFKQKEITISGEKYIVKELNSGDFSKYQSKLVKVVNGKPIYSTENAQKYLVLYSLCELDGKRVFKEQDIELVEKIPQSALTKIFNAATFINGMEDEEEIVKN